MHEILFADADRFPYDTVDGETVVLDSTRGHLFLFTGFGPWLWSRMSRGGSIEGVVNEVVARFGEQAEEPTRAFLQSLLEAGMLRTGAETSAPELGELQFPDTFTPPALEKYDEIADIIAMDPIHEVDPNKGWPRRQSEESGNDP